MTNSYKSLFLSYGGGPMPLLGDDSHQEMVAVLQNIASTITKPDAIVVVSAHWETAAMFKVRVKNLHF